MLGEELAREHLRDGLIAVERHVDSKGHAGETRDLAHVVVDRIPLRDAPRGLGMAHMPRVVQPQHGVEARQAGRHHLGTAAEAGEEMRLDEAGGDAHVSAEPPPIQLDGHARGGDPGVGQRCDIPRVVVHDGVARHDLGAEHGHQFLVRVGAMRAGGHQDGDVTRGHLRQRREDRLQHHLARLRPRDVAHRDGHRLALAHQRRQRRPGGGPLERLAQRGLGIAHGRHMARRHHDRTFFGQVHAESVGAVVELYSHEGCAIVARQPGDMPCRAVPPRASPAAHDPRPSARPAPA